MKKYQSGGSMQETKKARKTMESGYKPAQNAPKVTISPSSGSSKTPVKKTPTKKATPPRGTMDLIRGSKKSDYEGTVTLAAQKGGSVKKYKTGGMVNSNPKASASKVARGRVGGISSAPKTAVPKAKYGMSMRKK